MVESEVAGFALLELMAGFERIILIDAVNFDGVEPGTVVRVDPAGLRTSLRIRSVHEIDLPTALTLGRELGLQMPAEVLIFGIQAKDCWTLGERLCDAVREGMCRAVVQVLAALSREGGRGASPA